MILCYYGNNNNNNPIYVVAKIHQFLLRIAWQQCILSTMSLNFRGLFQNSPMIIGISEFFQTCLNSTLKSVIFILRLCRISILQAVPNESHKDLVVSRKL